MKTKFKYILGFASIAILASCGGNNYNSFNEVNTPVKVKDITFSSIQQTVTTTGTAKASKTVDLSTEASGKYQLMINPKTGEKFKLGDLVEKGTVIIKLENKEYVNSIQYDSKKLGLEIAENEWEAQKRLFKKGGVTLKEVNNSQNSYINSKYNLENAEISLGKLNIVAPFRSVIVSLPYHTENNKVPNGEKVLQLMNYEEMYMEIQLSEKSITSVSVGNKINVTNYTLKNDTLLGNVTQISPAVNPDTRTFNGYIVINNSERKLRPGMFIKADIITEKADSTIVIPKEIIRETERGKVVFIVERNRAREVAIKTGLETDTEVQVLEGLEKNQRIIISGYEMISNSSKVKIVK